MNRKKKLELIDEMIKCVENFTMDDFESVSVTQLTGVCYPEHDKSSVKKSGTIYLRRVLRSKNGEIFYELSVPDKLADTGVKPVSQRFSILDAQAATTVVLTKSEYDDYCKTIKDVTEFEADSYQLKARLSDDMVHRLMIAAGWPIPTWYISESVDISNIIGKGHGVVKFNTDFDFDYFLNGFRKRILPYLEEAKEHYSKSIWKRIRETFDMFV